MQDILPALGFAALSAILFVFRLPKLGTLAAMLALLGLVLGIGHLLGFRI
jgi:hypothetical protein